MGAAPISSPSLRRTIGRGTALAAAVGLCVGAALVGSALRASSAEDGAACTPGETPAGLATIDGEGAVRDGDGARLRSAPDGTSFRNITSGAGLIAFVADRAGADELVLLDAEGSELGTYQGAGELAHPAVGEGGVLVVERPKDAPPRILRMDRTLEVVGEHLGPEGTGPLSFPTWDGDSALVAVQEPITSTWEGSRMTSGPEGHEAAHLDQENANQVNLWRLEPGAGRWTRLTDFTATLDAWTVVSTSVARDEGATFVRATGLGSGTMDDVAYAEWEVATDGTVRQVRELDLDTYLAGAQDPKGRELYVRRLTDGVGWEVGALSDGAFERVGCGAVRIDNEVVDPDNAAHAEDPEPDQPDPEFEARMEDVSLTVVVGPIADARTAEAVAAELPADTGEWLVVPTERLPATLPPGQMAIVSTTHAQPLLAADEPKLMPTLEAVQDHLAGSEGVDVALGAVEGLPR